MRDYRFRGVTIKQNGMLLVGSWVTGGYFMDDCYGGCPEGKHYIVDWNSAGPGGYFEHIQVERESVGIYTGLNDKNGKEIYEGDILRSDLLTRQVGEVKYEGCSYIVYWHSHEYDSYLINCTNCEVIGNIYENPELLEG